MSSRRDSPRSWGDGVEGCQEGRRVGAPPGLFEMVQKRVFLPESTVGRVLLSMAPRDCGPRPLGGPWPGEVA